MATDSGTIEATVDSVPTVGRTQGDDSSARGRLEKSWELAGWLFPALIPAALTIFFAYRSGGYFAGATGLAAAEMALVVVIRLALSRRPFEGVSIPHLVAVASLGAFAGWILLSTNWSDSLARALPEYSRALLYALTLLFFGMLPFDPRRVRWMIYCVAAAIVGICVTAIIARTLPHVIFDSALIEEERLGYPLTYWNALGILAGVGIVLCGHLTCSTRDPMPVRVLGAAAIPLLALTLLYTLSRGGTWATVVAVVIYCVVGRPRALISGAIATVPGALIVILVANPPNTLAEGYPFQPAAVAAGKHVAIALAACMAGSALLRALLLPLDQKLDRIRLPSRARRPVLAGATATAVAIVVAGALALNVPGVAKSKYDQFTNKSDASAGGGGGRLLSASTNGRKEHWDVAMAAFHRNELHGNGAGTYSLLWARARAGTVHVEDAHSLFIETLGELGLVGFILLVSTLLLIVGAFAWRARGPDRAMFAALLAAGIGWAIAAGVDWDWEMPAVTLWLFAFGGAVLARRPRQRAEEGHRCHGTCDGGAGGRHRRLPRAGDHPGTGLGLGRQVWQRVAGIQGRQVRHRQGGRPQRARHVRPASSSLPADRVLRHSRRPLRTGTPSDAQGPRTRSTQLGTVL